MAGIEALRNAYEGQGMSDNLNYSLRHKLRQYATTEKLAFNVSFDFEPSYEPEVVTNEYSKIAAATYTLRDWDEILT